MTPVLCACAVVITWETQNVENRPLAPSNLTVDEWRLFIFISRESKWRTLRSAGNPRCAFPAEIHSVCTDRPWPGPTAGLQVSPTSDTSQSVAILMNRPHCDRQQRPLQTERRRADLPQNFSLWPQDLVMVFQSLEKILPVFSNLEDHMHN